ncbi:tetratricopeptide repeat protein, partial [Novosphingobium sp.]|uniref:tetratricopeptide repeat protein n=1 Tax=Novosphingobium sp. TaxID=1874826 RepID=UPI002B476F10
MKRFNVRTGAGLAVCSAMALALLTGCAGQAGLASAGRPAASGEQPAAMADRVIAKAEDRVARSPRNAAARVELAQAYLAVGRFSAAATTFEDAVALGESSPRLGLNQALAYIGSGRNDEALKVLDRWRNQIAASDLGLALALAGQSDQGVAVLSDALRGGDNTAKIRQNLAYAYALDGRWTEARVIASQDVPADQLDARMSEWASRGQSEQYRTRIAGLLGVPVGPDAGQPAELALNGVEHAARMAVMDAP